MDRTSLSIRIQDSDFFLSVGHDQTSFLEFFKHFLLTHNDYLISHGYERATLVMKQESAQALTWVARKVKGSGSWLLPDLWHIELYMKRHYPIEKSKLSLSSNIDCMQAMEVSTQLRLPFKRVNQVSICRKEVQCGHNSIINVLHTVHCCTRNSFRYF